MKICLYMLLIITVKQNIQFKAYNFVLVFHSQLNNTGMKNYVSYVDVLFQF